MLVQRRARLILALEDVAEARTQPHLAPAVEHDLRVGQVRVGHVVLVQGFKRAEDGLGKVLEGLLGQRADRLNQVVEAAVRCEIADDGDATLGAVPESVEDADVLLRGAVPLPVRHPSFENFSDLTVTNWDLFHAVDL